MVGVPLIWNVIYFSGNKESDSYLPGAEYNNWDNSLKTCLQVSCPLCVTHTITALLERLKMKETMPQLLGRAICKTLGLSPLQAKSTCSALWDVQCVGFCLVLWSRSSLFLSWHHTALSCLGWEMSNCGKESESQRQEDLGWQQRNGRVMYNE